METALKFAIRNFAEFDTGSIRPVDISVADGIRANVGTKDGKTKVMSYLFDASMWSSEDAEKWVEGHRGGKSVVTSKAAIGLSCQKDIVAIVEDVDEKDYTITHIISTKDVDREGDRMIARDFESTIKDYKDNPVVLWAHNGDFAVPKLPIGKNVLLEEAGDKTLARTQFAANEYPFAHLVYNLYKSGFLKGWSVGFDPKESEFKSERWTHGNTVQYISDWSLLEYSAAPIPMNAGAITLMYKTLSQFTDGAIVVPDAPTKARVIGYKGDMIDLDKAVKSVIQIIEKEGRILSGKNRALISEAVSALESLLEATDPNAGKAASTEAFRIVAPSEKDTEIEKLKDERNRLFRVIAQYQSTIKLLSGVAQ